MKLCCTLLEVLLRCKVGNTMAVMQLRVCCIYDKFEDWLQFRSNYSVFRCALYLSETSCRSVLSLDLWIKAFFSFFNKKYLRFYGYPWISFNQKKNSTGHCFSWYVLKIRIKECALYTIFGNWVKNHYQEHEKSFKGPR